MTIRRTIPYLLTILIFLLIYWMTMVIPNHILFLGYESSSTEVIYNNKIQLHLHIFNYGLTLVIVAINFLEILSTKQDKFWLGLLKSIVTVFLIYFITHLIFKLLHTRILNMHYHPRGMPANLWFIGTVVLTSIGLVFLEVLKEFYLFKFDKSVIGKFIPRWLRFERLDQ